MRYLSSVGLALSLIFGCLLLALVAEIYYLLWWKKRITNRSIEDSYTNTFCWKKPSSISSTTAINPQELNTHVEKPEALVVHHPNKDLWNQTLGEEEEEEEDDEEVEAELLRLQSLSGPPRFLFTIKEETKEDLESEEGKSSRRLSDLLLTVETPFMTPLASPPYFTPPLTPSSPYTNTHQGFNFNPLFGSPTDAEFNKIRSSPPPKFKFLKDAEEKLYRRKMMEEGQEEWAKAGAYEDSGYITVIVEKKTNLSQYQTGSSQVLPLASSPSSFRTPPSKKIPSQIS